MKNIDMDLKRNKKLVILLQFFVFLGVLASPWVIENWDSRILMLIDSIIIFIAAVYFFFIPVKSKKKII